jgi:hypothetical protein
MPTEGTPYFGRGQGFGMGRGRGFGRTSMYNPRGLLRPRFQANIAYQPISREEEIAILKQEEARLASMQEATERRINSLKKEK